MPTKLEMEKRILSTPLRLPNLYSEDLHLSMLATDTNFDYKDFLNPEEESIYEVDLHSQMEKILGLEVKNRF